MNEVELNIPPYIAPEETTAPFGYTRQIPVVFATNDNYAPYTATAIASILCSASPENYYRIYILHTGLDSSYIERLEGMGGRNAAVRCLQVQPLLERHGTALYERAHFTKETFYRFLIPEIFCDFSDVIYLDGDLVVTGDIADMLPADTGGAWVSAVRNVLTCRSAERVWDDFGVEPEKYFNAGVMMIHIGQWVAHGLTDRCFSLLAETPREKLVLLDQDILNAVCRGHVHFLDPAWNYCWHMDHTTLEEIERLFAPIKAAVDGKFKILHFASVEKPWNMPELPLASYFWKYAVSSPFCEEILTRSRASAAAEREKAQGKVLVEREKALAASEEERQRLTEALAAQKITSEKERQQLLGCLETQRTAAARMERQLEREKQEVEDIRRSASYRIGRAATWLPRKLRTLLRKRRNK